MPIAATSAVLDHALTYQGHGLAVFPLRAREKVPGTAHGVKDATTEAGRALRWWAAGRDANIAIAAGAVSGIAVVDVDDDAGLASLLELLREHGIDRLPKTPTASTGKGMHLLFKHPGRRVYNSVGKLAEGLDIRGDDGYIVAPPSIHPSGAVYRWIVGLDTPFAKLPEFLEEFVTTDHAGDSGGESSIVLGVVPQGQRRDTAFRDACGMRRRGLGEAGILAALRAENSTRYLIQTDAELVDIAHRAAKYEPNAEALADEAWQQRQRAKLSAVSTGDEDDEEDERRPRALPFRTGAELLATPVEPIEFLPLLGQPGWFVKGAAHLVSAFPKVGKTELLIRCIREWLDAGKSVVFLSEESERIWRIRLAQVGGDWSHFTILSALGLPVPAMLEQTFEREPDIVIVDTLRGVLAVADENKPEEMARSVNPWVAKAQQSGATLIILHHENKAGGEHGRGVSGGHGLIGALDVIIEIRREPGSQDNRRRISVMGRLLDPQEGVYERHEDRSITYAGEARSVALDGIKDRVHDWLESQSDWVDVATIAAAMADPKPGRASIDRALKELGNEERVIRDPPLSAGSKPGRKQLWRTVTPLAERLRPL